MVLSTPFNSYYVHYLTGDGVPPNGSEYGFGVSFPAAPVPGQYHLRTDYVPNRLFRFDGKHWIKFEDNVRMTINQVGDTEVNDLANSRKTQKTSFINNTNTSTIGGEIIPEKQALSKILKPKADN